MSISGSPKFATKQNQNIKFLNLPGNHILECGPNLGHAHGSTLPYLAFFYHKPNEMKYVQINTL